MNTQESSSIEKAQAVKKNVDPNCIEYIALWAGSDVAEKSRCDPPPSVEVGRTLGKLRVSLYACIIEKRKNKYKIESHVNQVQGWISNQHVKTTYWKNSNIRKICK